MHEVENENVVELPKPSRLKRIKEGAVTAAWIAVPVAFTAGSVYFSYKMVRMQYDAAQLNLEAAKRLSA